MDRISLCNVYCVLSHDYGLYGIRARLDDMGYRPGLSARNGELDETERDHYETLTARAERTGPWDRRLAD